MKRILILTLAAGLFSAATPALMAQVSTNTPGQSQNIDRTQQREQRRKLMQLLGLNPKDLKDLTPKERRAKIKEAAQPVIAQLEKKQADGTITADEASNLAALQKMVHGGHKAKSDT